MIKQLLVKLYLSFREWSWDIWALSYRRAVDCKSLPYTTYSRYLILAPHSDDEWIGCSCILRSNNEVFVCNMNKEGGDSDDIHRIRTNEMNNMCRLQGKVYLSVENNDCNSLINVIIKVKPDIIMLPYFYDWHEEHQEVMDTLYDVISSSPTTFENIDIGMYQVSVPIRQNAITHCHIMNKNDFQLKWKLFEDIYKSQHHIPYKRFAAYERINGALNNSYAAEVFVIKSAFNWREVRLSSKPSDEEVTLLKKHINSVHYIYSYINKNEGSI